MSDIQLNVKGDSSSGVRAMNDYAAATKKVADAHHDELVQRQKDYVETGKKSDEFYAEVASAAKMALAAVVAFAAASVKAYMEADKIQRQLARATGEYAETLGRQADAMEELFNVDGEVIKQSQTLLAQWGGVGAASEDVTRAVLDYAAATGKDAVSATQDLIRNVESGGVGLAKMGVHFDATGNKAEDLKRAVAALGAKFGGAAAADADSLHGQVEGVRIGFGNLMEDFGQFIAQVAAKTGVIEKVRDAVKSWREVMFGNPEQDNREEHLAVLTQINERLDHRKVLLAELQRATDEGSTATIAAAQRASTATIAAAQRAFVANEKNIATLKEQIRVRNEAIASGGLPDPNDDDTNKGRKDGDEAIKKAAEHAAKMAALHEKNTEEWKKYLQGIDDLEETAHKKDEDLYAEELSMSAKRVVLAKKEGDDKTAALQLSIAKDNELFEKQVKYRDQALYKMQKETNESNASWFRKQEQAWGDAGAAIGSALVTSIGRELERMMDGGDQDPGEMVANIIGDVLAVAGQAIGAAVGTAYGGAAGAQLGSAIGGAAGGLAGAGVKALGRAGRKSKYHDGGWIEPERLHDGGLIGPDERHIIAQTDEFMFSRQMVKNAGGKQAVESIARGEGGGAKFNFTIQTIDAVGTRQFFENDGGRGFFNALRTGRGSLLPAFGGG